MWPRPIGRCAGNRSTRLGRARSCRDARPRWAGHASGLVHGGNRSGRAAAHCRRPRGDPRVTARTDGRFSARAHGRTGHEPRPPVRAPRGHHRHAGRLTARRRVPRHVPSADGGIRHLLGSGLSGDVPGVRRDRRLLATEGVSFERLEEAVRQPSGSARAHRQRLPRARTVPADPQRSEVRGLPMLLETPKLDTARAGAAATSIRSTAKSGDPSTADASPKTSASKR